VTGKEMGEEGRQGERRRGLCPMKKRNVGAYAV